MPKDSTISASAITDQQAAAREVVVQESVHGGAVVLPGAPQRGTISTIKSGGDCALESEAENGHYEPGDMSLLPVTRVDVTKLIGVLRQLEVLARQQSSRIAFKANGRIVFMDLAEIVAVQAEGNYVSLRQQPSTYLLRGSISSIAEKLKPYGFIRIHRSVVVNTSAVEEIQPLPTGEYRLRVKGGTEYMVTRTYKDNLRDLAQLWVGTEHLCG
jgi:DNA-binding LytR/AlgR family response regulator